MVMSELMLSIWQISPWLILIIFWDMVWKAIGMWKSAKKNDLAWFVCIFIFNTAGILPILYIYVFSKDKKKAKKKAKKK